jgi:hypothetical protein
MKRGGPLRRGRGLERRSELRVDPDKVRAFVDRGRQELSRARAGFRRYSEAEGPLTPREWQERVFYASGGMCIVTGARARDVDDPRFEAHHVVPKRILRERGLQAYVWDQRNGVWLTKRSHARQESAFERLPAQRLPLAVWAFCRELDRLEGTEWATALVQRAHPPAGRAGFSR